MIENERHGEGPGSSQLDALTGVVQPTCFWEGCDQAAPFTYELLLIPRNSFVGRNVKVPLCRTHWGRARESGHVRLFTHPDNLLGM